EALGAGAVRAALDALAALVPRDPGAALCAVVARRMSWLLHEGTPIRKETWELWNSLVAGDSSSAR
ncbi:MAG: hypothetical protein Q7J79_02615, partial [Gemmatimonadales bacterium]|nr:hypothetical protein [Gemmatimonadales bacterium]